MQNELHEVTILKQRHFDEKTGFYIATLGTGDSIKVNGAILPVTGDVTVLGYWNDDPKYGRQLIAKQIYFKDPAAATAILLANGFLTGIKRSKALQISITLGSRIFEILEACIQDDPKDQNVEWRGQVLPASFVLMSVKGIGPSVYEQVIASYRKRRTHLGSAVIAIQAGLNMRQYRAALQEIGNDALIEYINKEPYKLSVVSWFNWETVDAIAQLKWEGKTPVPHDSPARLAAAMREVIHRQNSDDGHMSMPIIPAITEARKLATPNVDLWKTIADKTKEEGLLTLKSEGVEWITTKKLFDMENIAARNFIGILTAKPKFLNKIDISKIDVQKFAKFELAPEQKEAVLQALTENISVTCGGPGTGKTTAFLNTLLNIFDKLGVTYTLCAPTGKAAIRMSEATGRGASTLHREFRLFAPEDLSPLCTDYLIVDESSMISAEIMKMLSEVVEPGRRIVFIGDSDQLPPVGPGEPLLQFLNTPCIPSVKLKTIFRQGANSGIITAAHDINQGIDPKDSPNGDFVIQHVSETTIFNEVVRCIGDYAALGLTESEIMVITPINGKKDDAGFGRIALNNRMQEHYNPTGTKIRGTFFRIGDPVIQTKNDYDINIMNGQIGTIVWAKDNAEEVDAMFDEENEKAMIKVHFEGEDKETPITPAQVLYLQLAYALTIHKTQGSQYKAVIMIAPYVYKKFFLRQLVYTGITRAEQFCTVLNQGNALHSYVINEEKLRRMSLFSKMLTHYYGEDEDGK